VEGQGVDDGALGGAWRVVCGVWSVDGERIGKCVKVRQNGKRWERGQRGGRGIAPPMHELPISFAGPRCGNFDWPDWRYPDPRFEALSVRHSEFGMVGSW
jgi:hypothetical protein